jgi:hypothetical protein
MIALGILATHTHTQARDGLRVAYEQVHVGIPSPREHDPVPE